MGDEALIEDYAFATWRPAAPARPRLVVLVALVTSLLSAGVCVGAIPLVVAICVGCPMFAGWEVPNAVAALRANRAGKALARLRRSLDELPETEHPLGL
jgi:hypothetical protein